MAASSNAGPRILINPGIDQKDELEEKMLKNYIYVKEAMNGLSDREINDTLLKQSHAGQHDTIQIGLLCGLMVDPQQGCEQMYYKHMMASSRDSSLQVINKLTIIAVEKWIKLTDFSQHRFLWLFRQMMSNSIVGIEPVFHNLLRQIAGGDVSRRNLMLIDKMVDILLENRGWLDKQVQMGANAMTVYTFLRVLADHLDPNLAALKAKEVMLCTSILTTRFGECMTIGRDLIRVLQAVARIPEIEAIWKTMSNNPASLDPSFTGLPQLMSMKTPKRYLILRLTPDMESKLVFLTTKVKFGNHKRYQDWFQKQFLSTPESQSLRNDLIRFICCVIHPSNEMLQSDLIPRWAVIGWLLTTCTSNVAAATAKLALFWDWMFYHADPEPNIMNIEPGILVMQHSLKPHLQITVSLLDFLCRIIPTFHPSLKSQVKAGLHAALNDISNKKVLPSLTALFDSAKLDRELRGSIRESFPQFCIQVTTPTSTESMKKDPSSALEIQVPGPKSPLEMSVAAILSPNNQSENRPSSPISDLGQSAFSDDEIGEIPNVTNNKTAAAAAPSNVSPTHFKPIEIPKIAVRRSTSNNSKREGLDEYIKKVTQNDMKTILEQMKTESDGEKRCELTEKLLQTIDQLEEFDEPLAPAVAAAICTMFQSTFSSVSLPQELTDENLEDSIVSPLFVIFRSVCSLPMDEPSREDLTYLLHEMHEFEPRVGYLLLYFLKAGKTSDDKMHTYKAMVNFSADEKDLKTYILDDMKLCQEDDMRMFIYLLPDVYTNFPSATVNNHELMLLLCSTIDGTQLLEIMCQVLQGHLTLFKKDSIIPVLNHSLEWETIEQYFLWQLIMAHDLQAEHIILILPKLDFNKHAEAVTSLLNLLKQKSPSNDLMRACLCRHPSKQDLFTSSILKHWAKEDEDKTAECLAHFLSHQLGTPKKTAKRVRKEMPTIDNILAHLDFMRQTCKNISFLTNESIRNALQSVQQTSNELQKQKYSELFALIMDDEDEEEMPSKRNLRQTAARRANNASPKNTGDRRRRHSDSSSDSDEEQVRVQPAKKRKKGGVIDLEDSD